MVWIRVKLSDTKHLLHRLYLLTFVLFSTFGSHFWMWIVQTLCSRKSVFSHPVFCGKWSRNFLLWAKVSQRTRTKLLSIVEQIFPIFKVVPNKRRTAVDLKQNYHEFVLSRRALLILLANSQKPSSIVLTHTLIGTRSITRIWGNK